MKLKMLLLLGLAFFTQVFSEAGAQSFTVSGKVTSKKNLEPLVGATVTVKGTRVATQTDAQGEFRLSVPTSTATLVITYLGMEQVERRVTGATTLSIAMEDQSGQLEDVVVIGY